MFSSMNAMLEAEMISQWLECNEVKICPTYGNSDMLRWKWSN